MLEWVGVILIAKVVGCGVAKLGYGAMEPQENAHSH